MAARGVKRKAERRIPSVGVGGTARETWVGEHHGGSRMFTWEPLPILVVNGR
jgi:hypothetical protein